MATPAAVGPDTDLAHLYLIPTSILAALALGLCIARVVTRRRTRGLYADDYLIIVAMTLSLGEMVSAGGAAHYGWGHKTPYVDLKSMIQSLKFSFSMQVQWIIALALTRVSIAVSLLRFGHSVTWKAILWALICLQISISTAWMVIQFFQCTPIRAFWEPVASMSCWDREAIIKFSWFSSAFFCAMDLTLALMPIKLVRSLNRPIREKILICCLMAMGLCATVMAGVKMTTFKHVRLGDPLSATVRPSLYARLEEQVGLIAACAPCLKSPMEKLLKRIGVLSQRFTLARPSFGATSKSGPVGTINDPHGPVTLQHGSMVLPHHAVTLESTNKGISVTSWDHPLEEERTRSGGGSSGQEPWDRV